MSRMPKSSSQYSKNELEEFQDRNREIRGGALRDEINQWFAFRSVMSFTVPFNKGVMKPDASSLADIDVSPGASGVIFYQLLVGIVSTIAVTLASIIKAGDRYTADYPMRKLHPGSLAPPDRRAPHGSSGNRPYGRAERGARSSSSAGNGLSRRADMASMEEAFGRGDAFQAETASILGRPHGDGGAAVREAAQAVTNQRIVRRPATSVTEDLDGADIAPMVVLVEFTYAPRACDTSASTEEERAIRMLEASVEDCNDLDEDVLMEDLEMSLSGAAAFLGYDADDTEYEEIVADISEREKRALEESKARRREMQSDEERARARAEEMSRISPAEAPLRRKTMVEMLEDIDAILENLKEVKETVDMLENLPVEGSSAKIRCTASKMDLLDQARKLIQRRTCIEQYMREDRQLAGDDADQEDLLSPQMRGKIPFSGCSGEVYTGVRIHILNATTIQFSSILKDIIDAADQETIASADEPVVSTVRENLTHGYCDEVTIRREAAAEQEESQPRYGGGGGGGGGGSAADIMEEADNSARPMLKRARKALKSARKRAKNSAATAGAENSAGLITSSTYAVAATSYGRCSEASLTPYYQNEALVIRDIAGGQLDPEHVFSTLNALSWDDGKCHPRQSQEAYLTDDGGEGRNYFWGGETAVCSDGFRYMRLPTCNGYRVAPGDIRCNFLANMNFPSRSMLAPPGLIAENADRFPAECLESLGISPKPRRSGFSEEAPVASQAYLRECEAKRRRLEAAGLDGRAAYDPDGMMLSAAKHGRSPFDSRASMTNRFTAPDGRESPALQSCAAAAVCCNMASQIVSQVPDRVANARGALKMGMRRWAGDEVAAHISPTENRNSPSTRCVYKAVTTGVLSNVAPPVMQPYTTTMPAPCDAIIALVHGTHNKHCVAMSYEAVMVLMCTHTASTVKGNAVRNNISLSGPKGGGKSTIIKMIERFKLPCYISSDGKLCTTVRSMREWSPTALTAGPNDNDRRTTIIEEFEVNKDSINSIKNAMSSDILSRDVTFSDSEGNRYVITYKAMARSMWITTCNASNLCIDGGANVEDQAALFSRTPQQFISSRPESAINHMLRARIQSRWGDTARLIEASILKENFTDAFMMLYAELVVAEATPPPCEDLGMIILGGVAHTLTRNGHPSIEPRFFGFIVALATVMALNGAFYREWVMSTGRFSNQPLTTDRIVLATEHGVVVGIECIVMAIGFYSTLMSNMGHGPICAAMLSNYERNANSRANIGGGLTRQLAAVGSSADHSAAEEGRVRLNARFGTPLAPPRRRLIGGALHRAAEERTANPYQAAEERARSIIDLANAPGRLDGPLGHLDELVDPGLVDFVAASCPRKPGASFPAERQGVTRAMLTAAFDLDYLIFTVSDKSTVLLEKEVIRLGKSVSQGGDSPNGGTADSDDDDGEGYGDDEDSNPSVEADRTSGYHKASFFGIQGLERFFDPDRYPPRQAIRSFLDKLASGDVGMIRGPRYTLGDSLRRPFQQVEGRPTNAEVAYVIPSNYHGDKRIAVRLCYLYMSEAGTDAVAEAVQETLCCSSLKPQAIPFTPGPCGTMRLLHVGPGHGPGSRGEKDRDVSVHANGKPKTKVSAMSMRPYVMSNVFFNTPPSAMAEAEGPADEEDDSEKQFSAVELARKLQEDEDRASKASALFMSTYASELPQAGAHEDTLALNAALDHLAVSHGRPTGGLRRSLSGRPITAHTSTRASADSGSEDSFSEASDSQSQFSNESSQSGFKRTSLTEHQRRARKSLRAASRTISYQSKTGGTRKIAVIPDFDVFTAHMCKTKICSTAAPVLEPDMTIAERHSSRWLRGIVGLERDIFSDVTSLKSKSRINAIATLGAVGNYVVSSTACVYNHDPRGAGLPMISVAKARARGLLPAADTRCEAALRERGLMPDSVPIWAVASVDGTLTTYLDVHGRPATDTEWGPACEVAMPPLYPRYPSEILEDEAECARKARQLRHDERMQDSQLADAGEDYGDGEGAGQEQDAFDHEYTQHADDDGEEQGASSSGSFVGDRRDLQKRTGFVNMTDMFSTDVYSAYDPSDDLLCTPKPVGQARAREEGPASPMVVDDDSDQELDEFLVDAFAPPVEKVARGDQLPQVTHDTSSDTPSSFEGVLSRS